MVPTIYKGKVSILVGSYLIFLTRIYEDIEFVIHVDDIILMSSELEKFDNYCEINKIDFSHMELSKIEDTLYNASVPFFESENSSQIITPFFIIRSGAKYKTLEFPVTWFTERWSYRTSFNSKWLESIFHPYELFAIVRYYAHQLKKGSFKSTDEKPCDNDS